MIKKLILLAALLFMTCASAEAEEIIVQGEDYKTAVTNTAVSILPADSENPVLVISQWKGADMEYTVEYEFEAPSAGGYELSAVVTQIDSAYTSNFYYSINGGDYVYSADVFEKISQPGTNYGSNSMYLYTLGICELKSGTNTITFMINESRETQTNWAIFYLDYFAFTKLDFGLYSVTPSKPSHVFEEKDEAEFTLRFSDYPTSDTAYTVIAEDYFHNRIKAEKFTLSAGSLSAKLNLGSLPVGWYRLIISDGESNLYNSGFAVTHNLEDRKENPHFAMDFASFALVKSGKTEIENLSRAIRLAGIDFVRERYYWSYSDKMYKYQNEAISAQGFDVINMFCDTPSEYVSGGYMADDLFKVYDFQKEYAASYEDMVDYMEIWNEEDTSFATETADRYAAFLKAAAIGVTDGSSKMGKSLGGFANSPADTRYIDLCMLNDIMEYSDLYNYHAYASNSSDYENAPSLDEVELTESRDILTAYGYDMRRSWVTEGGISIRNDVERSRTQQARAAVINNVQSVANGNDKHFFFVMPQYLESGSEFGVFLADKTPSPSYTALENTIYQLGKAEYKGIFRDLPENVCGYLFNNGENDVGVFWAESGESFVQTPSETAVTLADMMGGEKTVSPCGGIVSIPVSMNPVFVVFSETVSKDCYAPCKKQTAYENAEINDAKRIVIQQNFEEKNYNDEKMKGYLMYKNEDNACTLRIYNFSSTEQTGTITAKVSDGFSLDINEQKVTVPAMSSSDITFNVTVNSDVTEPTKGFLQFSGVMNGNEITKSTSLIRCRNKNNIELAGYFERGNDATTWQTGNSTSSGSVTVSNTENNGELKFDVNLEGNGWSYPNFKVTTADIASIEGSTGIKFSVGAREDVGQAIMHCFVYMKDGRKYFEGNVNGKTIRSGYTDYYFPWSEMVRQHLPEGVDASKEFALEDIAYVAIGVNLSGTTSASYLLKDIGWYIDDGNNDVTEWDTLELTGAESGTVYFRGNTKTVTAVLPKTETIKSVKVYLSGEEYADYKMQDGSISVDLDELDLGVYTLLVTAENEFGYIYRDSLDFIIQ